MPLLVMQNGGLGFFLALTGLAHVRAMYFAKQIRKNMTQSQFVNGAAEDILQVAKSIGRFDQITLGQSIA